MSILIGEIVFISTHSLTRRLTVLNNIVPTSQSYFNSQPHKEADNLQYNFLVHYKNFNSQPHKEADGIAGAGETDWIYFNSQPHKEADKKLKFI